jgi:hypothetical protein
VQPIDDEQRSHGAAHGRAVGDVVHEDSAAEPVRCSAPMPSNAGASTGTKPVL